MLAGIAAMLWPGLAGADAIDGDWCEAGGARSLSIDGPSIRIPSGAEIRGEYDRHAFRYVGPDGDPEAGQVIKMRDLQR